jgi:UDP-GlcNAc:undecaprenyl-phosphate/decaprenyl-phosphate GlcNAc-1-phosphate transferase
VCLSQRFPQIASDRHMTLILDSITFACIGLAFATSFCLTAIARVVARRTGMLDRPDGRRKSQAEPMPLLGGVAVYLSLLITIAVARWVLHWEWLAANDRFVVLLLVSGGLFCAVGLWDDRVGLRPRAKLLSQILACLPFVLWGRSVDSIHVFDAQIALGFLGAVFTIFWLVACSNVINLVDGLDGLAGTIGVICCVAVAVLSNMQGFNAPLALGLVAAASLCGFLLHNWPPASIYLGDSGSLMIGFLIGALAIESSIKKATGFALAIPLVLVSVPVFDTCMAILRRKLNGKAIGEADRGHIHHYLQDRGLSRAKSLLVISALCMVMAGVTLVSAYFQNDKLALGLCLALLALLIVGRVFGYDETVLFFRYIQAMSTLLATTSGVLQTQMAVDRMARAKGKDPIDHWNELTERIAAMGGVSLSFLCHNQTGADLCRLEWTGPQTVRGEGAAWQFQYSLPGADGLEATLSSQGRCHPQLRSQRMVDLFRLFDTFCRSWLSDPAFLRAGEASATIIAFPEPAPKTERLVEPVHASGELVMVSALKSRAA